MEGRIVRANERLLKIEFLGGAKESLMEALRRIMISEVPTIAMETVLIQKNTCSMEDEQIIRRVKDIILTSNKATAMHYYNDCPTCKGQGQGCALCSVVFSINVKCNEKETLDITIKDLTSSDITVTPVDFKDTASGGAVIVKLGPGEELELKAIARKGIGKNDQKWSPVTTVDYEIRESVAFSSDHYNDFFRNPYEDMVLLKFDPIKQKVVCCKQQPLIEVDPVTKEVTLSKLASDIDSWYLTKPKIDPHTQKDIKADVGTSAPKNEPRKAGDQDHFMFTVKTSGALKPGQLLMSALEILKKEEDIDQLYAALADQCRRRKMI